MELWIRSQDKMTLAKFDLCILEKYDDKYMFIVDHYKNMGTYKTKERALEVLDEIQKILTNAFKVEGNYQEADITIKAHILSKMIDVYNMPKE